MTQAAAASAYVERMQGWLEQGRYQAAVVRLGSDVVGYVLWRDEPEYGDVFVRQFFIARGHRSAGLGRDLFELAASQLWAGRSLRLDVYDSNPRGRAFWERIGFVPYSRLLRRPSPS